MIMSGESFKDRGLAEAERMAAEKVAEYGIPEGFQVFAKQLFVNGFLCGIAFGVKKTGAVLRRDNMAEQQTRTEL